MAETHLCADQLVLPLFARAGRKLRREIGAMPGVFQLSPDEVLCEASRAHEAGVPAVLLFGLPEKKDAKASGAYARSGIVQQTVRLLKKEMPSLLVITDVCLCEYMSHGHCGIVQRDARGAKILNDPTLKLLAQTAASVLKRDCLVAMSVGWVWRGRRSPPPCAAEVICTCARLSSGRPDRGPGSV